MFTTLLHKSNVLIYNLTLYNILFSSFLYMWAESINNTGICESVRVHGYAKIFVFVCLFYFESHEQLYSYLATVTIAHLDVCLALTAFEGSFTCHTYCDTGPPFFKVISERPVILTSEYRALSEGAITSKV
jgi:hypothetical protein